MIKTKIKNMNLHFSVKDHFLSLWSFFNTSITQIRIIFSTALRIQKYRNSTQAPQLSDTMIWPGAGYPNTFFQEILKRKKKGTWKETMC